MTQNYLFDENSVTRIVRAVKWVEEQMFSYSEPTVENPIEEDSDILRGQFSGEWAIGSDATVTLSSGVTKTATNYFATVGEDGATRNCCIVLAGGEWILIAAQCESFSVPNVVD